MRAASGCIGSEENQDNKWRSRTRVAETKSHSWGEGKEAE